MFVHLTDPAKSTAIEDPDDPRFLIGELVAYCGADVEDGGFHVFTADPAAAGCQGCINRLCDEIFG